MKKDIEILERIINRCRECKFAACETCEIVWNEVKALENLIKRYKELEENKEKLKEDNEAMFREQAYLEEKIRNSILKSKIEEKIKDLESKKDIKDNTTYTFKELEEVVIQVLQELLESEENK